MSFKQDSEDKWMKWIAMMQAFRSVVSEPESQIHTQEPISIKTRFGLQVLNSFAVLLSFVFFVLGAYLFGNGINAILNLGLDPGTYLALWISALIVIIIVVSIIKTLLKSSLKIVQSSTIVIVGLIGGLILFSFATGEDFNPLSMAGMVLGAGIMLASLALGYNQLSELINPYWRRSPYEQEITRQIFPMFSQLFRDMEQPEQKPREVDPAITFRANGKVQRPVPPQHRPGWQDAYVPGEEEFITQDEQDWEDELADLEEDEEITIKPETGNLIWFANYVTRCRSLSLNDLKINPAPLLPFEERGRQLYLRKMMIRRLLARGSTEHETRVNNYTEFGLGDGGWWRLGGAGAVAEFVKSREQIRKEAAEMWHDVMNGYEVPDYWSMYDEMEEAA